MDALKSEGTLKFLFERLRISCEVFEAKSDKWVQRMGQQLRMISTKCQVQGAQTSYSDRLTKTSTNLEDKHCYYQINKDRSNLQVLKLRSWTANMLGTIDRSVATLVARTYFADRWGEDVHHY